MPLNVIFLTVKVSDKLEFMVWSLEQASQVRFVGGGVAGERCWSPNSGWQVGQKQNSFFQGLVRCPVPISQVGKLSLKFLTCPTEASGPPGSP